MAQAKRRCGVAADVPVPGVDAAGREGFWRHRCLRAHGIQHVVVEASSLEVNRRDRRSKTDQLDVQQRRTMLVRFVLGESRRWQVVRVPSTEDETLRQPQRELIALQEERTPHSNRMTGLLAGLGLAAVSAGTCPEHVQALRPWDGHPVPARLQARLLRECARWSLVQRQIQDVAHAEARMVRDDHRRHVAPVRTLMRVRGLGAQSAWLVVHAVCGWREIRHRRALAALAGWTPTPDHAGPSPRAHGSSQAGRKRRRWLMVELAWGWRHGPPESQLSRW